MSTRRQFLAASRRVSVATWMALGRAHLARAAADGGTDTLRLLALVARTIFPHDDLPDEVYVGIVGELLMDPQLRNELLAGAGELADVLELDETSRTASLEQIETGEFFATFKTPLMFALYNTRQLWALIGYPGPSFPIGYVNRGFDDIDWLPSA